MAEEKFYMNKQHGAHLSGGKASLDEHEDGTTEHKPHIHVHSHAKGHTVHVMHHDGRHEKFEHAHGDADGIAEHIHRHLGGAEGQDHGYSSEEGEPGDESIGV